MFRNPEEHWRELAYGTEGELEVRPTGKGWALQKEDSDRRQRYMSWTQSVCLDQEREGSIKTVRIGAQSMPN